MRALPRAVLDAPLGQTSAYLAGALCCILLYWRPLQSLLQAWWQETDAGGGILLAATAIYLMWQVGAQRDPRAGARVGLLVLAASVALRVAAEAAAERYALGLSLVLAIAAGTIYYGGIRQLLRWWAPLLILFLAVPLPMVINSQIAWPMQLISARLATAMLELRSLPVVLDQNLILLPNHLLIVTEGCSGIRSAMSLFALSLVAGAVWLRTPWARALLALSTLPTCLLFNAFRIFLTGFLMHYVAPEWGQGRLHEMAGYVIFIPSLLTLGVWLHLAEWGEQRLRRPAREVA